MRQGIEAVSAISDEDVLQAGVNPEPLKQPNYVKAASVLDDIELFDADFFAFSPRDAEITDPQQRLFLECCWEALEQAGYSTETYKGWIGVYGGVGSNDYLAHNLSSNPWVQENVSQLQLNIGNEKDFLTTRVSYKLNLHGPSVVVQSACSTSLLAVHMACQSLLTGECEMALAGGAAFLIPQKQGYLYLDGDVLSPDGHCRSFDA